MANPGPTLIYIHAFIYTLLYWVSVLYKAVLNRVEMFKVGSFQMAAKLQWGGGVPSFCCCDTMPAHLSALSLLNASSANGL